MTITYYGTNERHWRLVYCYKSLYKTLDLQKFKDMKEGVNYINLFL